jgi:CubicO group peptidase (beta-lactamase class C family)
VLITRATGKSLGDFLQARIFAPLGMKDTEFSVPERKLDRLPTAYSTNSETGSSKSLTVSRTAGFRAGPSSSRAPGGWSRRLMICLPSAR